MNEIYEEMLSRKMGYADDIHAGYAGNMNFKKGLF